MQVCMNSVLLVSLRNSVDFAVAVTCSCSLALSLYWLVQIECMYSWFKLDRSHCFVSFGITVSFSSRFKVCLGTVCIGLVAPTCAYMYSQSLSWFLWLEATQV